MAEDHRGARLASLEFYFSVYEPKRDKVMKEPWKAEEESRRNDASNVHNQ